LLGGDGQSVGFALVAPRARTLEIFYLGVDPDAWCSGVGTRLLLMAEDHAREIGRETLELWVINDNERAIRVYERSGWVGTEGKTEYVLRATRSTFPQAYSVDADTLSGLDCDWPSNYIPLRRWVCVLGR
jgi:ribosomal protein S18 acetylase RimI-like enzyme